MTKLDERGAHAADELRRELASLSVPEPTRLVRRARHTRIVTAAAAALVVGIGSLAVARAVDSRSSTRISTGNQPPSAPHDAPPSPRGAVGNVPTPTTAPTPLGAPLVEGPDAASTLLTSWGEFHPGGPYGGGYVFIYGDGRVISHADDPGGIIERRLSRRGLALVRAGKLDAGYFLGHSILRPPFPRKKLWAERTPRIWEPSKYALCPSRPVGGGGVALNATDVVDELPAPVRAVLDGRQRIFDPSIGTAHWDFWRTGTWRPGMTDCFELTAAETSTLYQIIEANGFIGQDPIQGAQGWDRVFMYGNLMFVPEPIFPHGQYVIWGG